MSTSWYGNSVLLISKCRFIPLNSNSDRSYLNLWNQIWMYLLYGNCAHKKGRSARGRNMGTSRIYALGDEQNRLGVWKEGEAFCLPFETKSRSYQLRSSAETSQRLYHKTETRKAKKGAVKCARLLSQQRSNHITEQSAGLTTHAALLHAVIAQLCRHNNTEGYNLLWHLSLNSYKEFSSITIIKMSKYKWD